jgi:hypothetical protein
MSLSISGLLNKLSPELVKTISLIISAIADAPEGERQAIAARALKAAASKAGTEAAVDEVLKRGK